MLFLVAAVPEALLCGSAISLHKRPHTYPVPGDVKANSSPYRPGDLVNEILPVLIGSNDCRSMYKRFRAISEFNPARLDYHVFNDAVVSYPRTSVPTILLFSLERMGHGRRPHAGCPPCVAGHFRTSLETRDLLILQISFCPLY